jgi:hypothetical protein
VGAGEGGRGGGGMIPWEMIGACQKIEQSGKQKYLSFITSEQPTFRSISSMAYPINDSKARYNLPYQNPRNFTLRTSLQPLTPFPSH